ncbi:MAG: BsuBI/PstI family type II restriction endonuclease, partial [Candidatus Cryptobacteroides sp.]
PVHFSVAKLFNFRWQYTSAFPSAKEFKKHFDEIAWETEVWFSDTPDHMIHFNGDRFIGPRR